MREVLEEVGFDISSAIDESVFIEKQHKGLPLTRLYIARNVPDDTPFLTRTKKEIDEIKWYERIDKSGEHPSQSCPRLSLTRLLRPRAGAPLTGPLTLTVNKASPSVTLLMNR